MLKSTEVEVIINSKTMKYYESKGYNINSLKRKDDHYRFTVPKGTKLLVKVEDLPESSNIYVDIECDYCGKIFPRIYNDYNNKSKKSIIKKDCCEDCKGIKNKEIFNLKYGVDNPMKLEQFKIKSINSSLDKYSVEHASQLKENKQYLREFKRTDFKIVKKDFFDANFILLITEEEYENSAQYMKCICNNHPDIIQYKKYSHLKEGHICKYCAFENNSGENNYNWKGGISKLKSYLSHIIIPWKKDSMKNCNYKCILTGKRFDDIHHLYGFNSILDETLNSLNLEYKDIINEYLEDHLKQISDKFLELHYKYPLGVCLTKEIHMLFHSIYKYGRNTPQQFTEFQQRYNDGEFTSLLSAS